MNALILYFSGTGNTKLVAEDFKERLRQRNFSVALHSIEEQIDIGKIPYDIFIVGFPKYCEYPVFFMLDYLKQNLPDAKKSIPTLAFCTQAGPLKTDFSALEKLLSQKNHRLTAEVSFQFSNNMSIFRIFKPTAPSVLKKHEKIILDRTGPLLDDFLNGKILNEKTAVWQRPLIYLTAILFTKLMPVFGMRFSADENCNHCGLCEKHCPAGNIKIKDGKPVFGKHCLFCMRCISSCPENSILYNGRKCWQYKVGNRLE